MAVAAALVRPVAGQISPATPAAPAPGALDSASDLPVATLPDGTRRVAGRVVRPRDSTMAGVPGVWVTLHRVGRDAAGPVDSMRTGGDGRYTIRYRPTGASDAIYFVAASHGGIAYFSAPLRGPDVRGEAAEITVFDTTSRAVPLAVRGRHLIVAAPDAAGAREILEVFELSNDSSVTAVPATGSARGVWATPLPPGVTRVTVRESGDLPPDGLAVAGGAATLMVPVAPGLKQVAFSYRLPADGLPLRVVVPRPTGLFEVLLEEGGAAAQGGGLAPVAPVALEGKSFRRFLAQETPAGATVTVSAGTAGGRPASRVVVPVLIAVVGGGMAVALVAAGRRRPGSAPAPRPAGADAVSGDDGGPLTPVAPAARERLLAELAALDDAHAAAEPEGAEAHAEYSARREALRARLAEALTGVGAPD